MVTARGLEPAYSPAGDKNEQGGGGKVIPNILREKHKR